MRQEASLKKIFLNHKLIERYFKLHVIEFLSRRVRLVVQGAVNSIEVHLMHQVIASARPTIGRNSIMDHVKAHGVRPIIKLMLAGNCCKKIAYEKRRK